METNKKRIELLDVSVRGLHDNMNHMELRVNDKLHNLEAAINRILEAILVKQDPTASHALSVVDILRMGVLRPTRRCSI